MIPKEKLLWLGRYFYELGYEDGMTGDWEMNAPCHELLEEVLASIDLRERTKLAVEALEPIEQEK